MNAIELNRVSKTFGRVTALADLTLSVRAGELTALLGPNGAGKTTAISLMQGLAAPSAGEIRVLGGDPRRGAVRARIGAMPQESALPPALKVREAVALFASLYPAPLSVSSTLALADLDSVAERRAGALSGGQKRRLAFALAAVGNPEVLLIDEPTTGMDAQSRLAFWDAVTELKAAGRTILLTTHYLEEAERAADRVVVMRAGQVLADGTPEALRAQAGGARVRFASDLVLTELQRLPGVESVTVDARGHAELRTATPEALLRALYARDVPFTHLEVTRASLEDAFLTLTAPAGPAGKDVTA
ncbi:ABC transporter ATP-binding protein (plasmid) [Deinococcus taeanensis]|uniref:ABC transporter ATP-binding protein n=1 Tax=Deinococcus taeanensis TaxID=2737050 RepID=UPI001CDD7F35|nr:ABC transporter ATP-binding protein [Deinococcus taeanensis]UBV44191.1 ABC transporter ATP-binding protein [Deinococcus taeanensis]